MSKIIFISIIIILSYSNAYSADKTITINDSISIYLKEDSLDYELFFKNYKNIINLGWTNFIDNKPVYGIDVDGPPQTILSELIVLFHSKKIYLDVSYMYEPLIYQIGNDKIRIVNKKDLLEITVGFSDGAGAYAAQWLIFNNQSFRTIISHNEGVSGCLFKY